MKKVFTIFVICLIVIIASSTAALAWVCSPYGCGAGENRDHYFGSYQYTDGKTYRYAKCSTFANYTGYLKQNALNASVTAHVLYINSPWSTESDGNTAYNANSVIYDSRTRYPQVVDADYIKFESTAFCFHCLDELRYVYSLP